MTDSPVHLEDDIEVKYSELQEQLAAADEENSNCSSQHNSTSDQFPPSGGSARMPDLTDSHEISVLRDENSRLLTTLLEYKKMLENTKLRYGTVKRDYYAAKKRLKRMANKLQAAGMDGSESGMSTPAHNSSSTGTTMTTADDEIRKKWKEPNLKAAVKLKAAIGVQAYQSLIRDGELQLPSLRTISRYVDALKKAGLKPNYDFNVRDSDSVGRGEFMMEDDDSGDVDHNRNQQQHHQGKAQQHDGDGPITAVPDISFYHGSQDPEDLDEDDESDLYHNGGDASSVGGGAGINGNHHGGLTNGGDAYPYYPHPNQHTQQQTLTSAHIEFLKSMTGFRKKWTPFELRTCMDIRRIIGSKEYDSLRKNDGMPLPSAKTLRKYKHAAHLDGVDVMGRKRTHKEMMEGSGPGGGSTNGSVNGGVAPYGDDVNDILNAEEPDGFFDINGLSEEQIDFLQSLSSNTKGFSDYELQKTLELKNELGGKNYEILRKQECLHIPTLAMLRKYEQDNGLEDLSAMVVAEDLDEDDEEQEQEPEQEPDQEQDYENDLPSVPHHLNSYEDMNGTGEDSHMGIFEHHSIFDKDDTPAFDMSKLSQEQIEFLTTLPENPKRWTTHMINSALDIKNLIGTRDYEMLRRQGIALPAARTLRRHKDIKSRAGGDVGEIA